MVKIVQSFLKIYRMNQSTLEKIFYKIAPIDCMKGYSHVLCKKDLQKHLQKKGRVGLIFKTLLPSPVEDERIVV